MMKNVAFNKFLDLLFGDHCSLSPSNFDKRCRELGKDPGKVKSYLLENENIKIIANNHIEFRKYENTN